MPELKTPAEVRAEFIRRGISIKSWAQEHDCHPHMVYALLNPKQRIKGLRGSAHRVAVLLGIKDGVIEEPHASQGESAKQAPASKRAPRQERPR